MEIDQIEPAMNRNYAAEKAKNTWRPFGPSLTLERVVTSNDAGIPQIALGSTRLSDYTKISVLGKGTYGEVHKCIHNPSGAVVAMKTFLFEVST